MCELTAGFLKTKPFIFLYQEFPSRVVLLRRAVAYSCIYTVYLESTPTGATGRQSEERRACELVPR